MPFIAWGQALAWAIVYSALAQARNISHESADSMKG